MTSYWRPSQDRPIEFFMACNKTSILINYWNMLLLHFGLLSIYTLCAYLVFMLSALSRIRQVLASSS